MKLQQSLFVHLKSLLPPHHSLVDEVAELLNISNDTAYRRIRGEKEITFSETSIICNHFKISVDAFLKLEKNAFVFQGMLIDSNLSSLKEYLTQMLNVLHNAGSAPNARIYLNAKDMLPLHNFKIPELAAFYLFCWSKTLFTETDSAEKFRPEDFDVTLLAMATEISKAYIQIKTTEIWSHDILNSSLRQVNYMWQGGYFSGKQQTQHIFRLIELNVNHLEEEAAAGEKFLYGKSPSGQSSNFELYVNDVIPCNDTIISINDNFRQVLINHNVVNFMSCSDEDFYKHTYECFQNTLKKLNLISVNNEKDRVRFFNTMRDKIKQELSKL